MINQRWRVYNEKLRDDFPDKIIEVQTVSGQTVIPWSGFDDSSISKTTRLVIARRIVRLHNAELNRDINSGRMQ